MELDNQGKQPEGQAAAETSAPEVKATTPTAEEKLQGLQTELDKLKQSQSSLQGILRTKDTELKKQTDFNSRIDAINERIELLATAIASGQRSEEDIANLPKEDRNKVLDELRRMKQTETARQQQNESAQKGLEFKQRVEATGLTEDDERYWEIEDLVTRGKFSYADTKLKKIEKEKTTVVDTTKSVQDEVKKLAEQMYQDRLKKEGLLKTDTLSPSGGSLSDKEIEKQYADTHGQDPRIAQKYIDMRRRRGL